jgi:hypothetical protein
LNHTDCESSQACSTNLPELVGSGRAVGQIQEEPGVPAEEETPRVFDSREARKDGGDMCARAERRPKRKMTSEMVMMMEIKMRTMMIQV